MIGRECAVKLMAIVDNGMDVLRTYNSPHEFCPIALVEQ